MHVNCISHSMLYSAWYPFILHALYCFHGIISHGMLLFCIVCFISQGMFLFSIMHMQVYMKVEFAGSLFRTYDRKKQLVHDDTNLRLDYMHEARGGDEVRQAFARITRLISHEAYPGGPTRIIVEGTWYEFMGTCPIAHTPLVKKNKRYFMNLSSRFAFLDNCYQRPVAVWPHDPLDKLPDGDPRKKWFDIIDKNQNEVF